VALGFELRTSRLVQFEHFASLGESFFKQIFEQEYF
jgi:hypothetical protein